MMGPMTEIHDLPQVSVPFWGGPAHGEAWATTQHVVDVSIPEPLSYRMDEILDPTVPAIKTARYQVASFPWQWRVLVRQARMFLPMNPAYDTPAVIDVESVLQFLGGLWGRR